MSHTPYTQKRNYQFRGPNSSEDYNLRVEENYKDLVVLYNTLNEIEATSEESASYFYKEIMSLAQILTSIEARVSSLEDTTNSLYFTEKTQIVNDLFNSTAFSIPSAQRCTFKDKYNFVTLPHIESSSVSKIKYKNADGSFNTSSNLEILIQSVNTSADSTTALVETSQPYNAIVNEVGRVWQRNVVVNSPNVNGAQLNMYIKIPNDLSVTEYTNCILMDVFPIYGVEVTDISYSTDPSVQLNSSSTWTPLNSLTTYYNIDEAIGFLPPGAWTGDSIVNAGPKAFYFPQKAITAIRIGLKRSTYYQDGASYIYSYGMSDLDIRFDKFADSGSFIIQYDAPAGKTISNITSVQPYMWNVPEYLVNQCFSYQIIWETSFGSGIFTTTPVPLSQRVWVKVTLDKGNSGDQLPVLSNLILKYS